MPVAMYDDVDPDARALREALALLGDWESELEALLAPPATPPPGAPPKELKSKSASSAKRPRPSGPAAPTEYRLRRDARNTKLAELQDEARRLQDLLAQEQARIARRAAASRSPLALECEEMAGRQKRQRVLAQEQNAALRSVVAAQLELTRRMRKLADKASWLGDATGETRLRAALSLGVFNGPMLGIPQYVRHLDSRVDEAAVVLSSGVFEANRGCEFQQVSFRDLGFDGLQVEFAISWVVPFDVAAVERALWAHMTCTKHRERATDHQVTHSASDLMCSRFVSEPRSGDQPNCNHGQPIAGVTHGQAAVRRYEPRHDGARVVMTHIRARILHEDGKPKGDMHGDGWFQVEPVEGTTTALTPHASRIKWCRRVTGRPVDHDAATSGERARWVHSVVTGPMRRYWERTLSLNMASVENALLS